eukprot:CAMPEP_0206419612 /NCGR_PEP_ID=MMETSP0324_2-20121206/262_1 /ASSEMBLY_ACC=CAM_ASM_000836 /TAXON_ID=2866 /ORGANISM="Crypthecodinium cohnii, Strain Seligo" /LENGTH=161 /DNA_ID=CAMNT_0053883161 /DNA_START=66 /DNA_END=551 /DNA_ORIENTATION=-
MTSPQSAAKHISESSPPSPDVEIADPPPPIVVRYPFHSGPESIHRLSSLSSYLEATRPFGYSLLHVEYMNAVLIRNDLAALIPDIKRHTDEEKWRIGYYCHPLRTMLRWSPSVALRRYKTFDSAIFGDPSIKLEERFRLAKEVFTDGSVTLDSLYDPWQKQ